MTIFRSMTPDRDSTTNRRDLTVYGTDEDPGDWFRCETCNARIYAGDWPWCTDGTPSGHTR